MKKQIELIEQQVFSSVSPRTDVPGASIGIVAGFTETGEAMVDVLGRRLVARLCVPLATQDVGREAVVMFESALPESPILLGLIQAPVVDAVDVTIDGQKVSLSANESITLRCGDASLTLNRDGKIIIRGAHVVSHAAGVNRIRGGSVELN